MVDTDHIKNRGNKTMDEVKRRVGRPSGFKMCKKSKEAIAKSKTGYKMPQEVKDKIRKTLLEKNKGGGYRVGKGKFTDKRGYVLQYIGSGHYVREHRLVIEELIDRELMPGEVIHHLNKIKDDNTATNLLLCDSSEHGRIHTWMDRNNINAINYGSPEYKRLLDEVLNKEGE